VLLYFYYLLKSLIILRLKETPFILRRVQKAQYLYTPFQGAMMFNLLRKILGLRQKPYKRIIRKCAGEIGAYKLVDWSDTCWKIRTWRREPFFNRWEYRDVWIEKTDSSILEPKAPIG
jgi:hypothetical protein